MKISFSREKFSQAFQIAAAVTAKRDVKPILQNVKIRADENGVLLQATDTEVGVRVRVSAEDCNVSDMGQAILPTSRVRSILTECPEETLVLESTESKTTITAAISNNSWSLDTQEPDEFPDVEEFEAESYHEIPAKTLKEMIRRTIFATDQDNARYALGGVKFELVDDKIDIVATDGRRMAWQSGAGTSVGSHKAESSILPVKGIQLLERTLPIDDSIVKVAIDENHVLFQHENVVMFSRLVEGRFPKWRSIIPDQEKNVSINIMAGALYSAVRQAAITTSEREPGVFFTFDEGKLTLRGTGREIGESKNEVPITYTGEKKELKLDPKYMTEVLRVLEAEQSLEVYPPMDSNPFVVKTDDGYLYIVMPMS